MLLGLLPKKLLAIGAGMAACRQHCRLLPYSPSRAGTLFFLFLQLCRVVITAHGASELVNDSPSALKPLTKP